MHLEDEILQIRPDADYCSVTAARSEVEPLLERWALSCDLEYDNRFDFEYVDAEVESQLPGEQLRLASFTASACRLVANASVIRSQYPIPPKGIEISPSVRSMLNRYRGYREGKEPLMSMAYYCLTEVETLGSMSGQPVRGKKSDRKRAHAAATLNIDEAILNTLGDLTSNKGGSRARKSAGKQLPETPTEAQWVRLVVKALIRRTAQYEAGAVPAAELTLRHFPSLK
jgi:hypothetical protein